jgi:acyl transferase domain-containing protein/acyl carrier protein
MDKNLQRDRILEGVKTGRITPDEGLIMIKALLRDGESAATPGEEDLTAPGRSGQSAGPLTKTDRRMPERGREDSEAGAAAIIGISGRFPDAQNIEEFWANLAAGRGSVSEIPRRRWRWEEFIRDNPVFAGVKSGSRRGAFLTDIDHFDPAFFDLSVKEAEMMDPRQRLFLQEAWKALEDAGYSDRELDEKECGVFVGCQEGDYLKSYQGGINPYLPTGNSNSILAARIAYFLNLKGPAIAIDTACSSGLVAVHLACQSIAARQCALALAGGVSVLATPAMFLSLEQLGMFSGRGQCRVFDDEADGTVIGEAVGVIVLKSLAAAVRDGDHIYGVIKGSAVNQDGRTSGITAPSASSQTALESQLYHRLGINPETIGYIEAHGTGTKLGDPIEIQALTDAFREFTAKQGITAVGSVKTNIGHSMPVAGIASLIKVLGSIRRRRLFPSLNFNRQNSHIDFATTPFYVNTTLKEWLPPAGTPRRAAVSSFGFSGTNCHMVIEEPPALLRDRPVTEPPACLILIAAKTEAALIQRVRDLTRWLEQKGESVPLMDIGFTLNCGRSHFGHRIACIVKDHAELRRLLEAFPDSGSCAAIMSSAGKPRADHSAQAREEMEGIMRELAKNGAAEAEYRNRLYRLAQMYVNGNNPDWKLLFAGRPHRRISLPVYPFSQESYWHNQPERQSGPTPSGPVPVGFIHPLVHWNTSTMEREKFDTLLVGDEFFLRDHLIGGTKVMPGAAQLEMARAAGFCAAERAIGRISNIVWTRPVIMSGSAFKLQTAFSLAGEGLDYEITGLGPHGEKLIYSRGRLDYTHRTPAPPQPFDLESLKQRSVSSLNGEECYGYFRKMGFDYGESFRTIRELYICADEALSRLELPETMRDGFNDFGLHPSLIDGAFQTIMGVKSGQKEESDLPNLPFLLGELEIYRPLEADCYVYIRRVDARRERGNGLKQYDLTITDPQGNVLTALRKFSLKAMNRTDSSPNPLFTGERGDQEADSRRRTLYLESEWVKTSPPSQNREDQFRGDLLVFAKDERPARSLGGENLRPGFGIVTVRPGSFFHEISSTELVIRPDAPEDYQKLLQTLAQNGVKPAAILHAWNQEPFQSTVDSVRLQLQESLYSVTFLVRELLRAKSGSSVRIIYTYPYRGAETNPVFTAVNGFANTLRQEAPQILFKTVATDQPTGLTPELFGYELETEDGVEVKYENGQRAVKRVAPVKPGEFQDQGIPLKAKGVYLITGGLGGLGFGLGRYLARNCRARLLLMGRSPQDERIDAKLAELRSLGGEAFYIRADIATPAGAAAVFAARRRYGGIDGVIHCAGLNRDSYVRNKTAAEIDAVLASKVLGSLYLYEAVKDAGPDFLMFFSSVAALLGNAGQSDYAYANRFMDDLARRNGKRGAGRTRLIAVNWPLWRDGGMKVDPEYLKMTENLTGMLPLSDQAGMAAFETALRFSGENLAVVYGFDDKIRRVLGLANGDDLATLQAQKEMRNQLSTVNCQLSTNQEQVAAALLEDLLKIAAQFSKGAPCPPGPGDDIQEYGFDSVTITAYSNAINERFELGLTPAVFFELDDPTIASLALYLRKEYQDKINAYYRNVAGFPSRERRAAPDSEPASRRFAGRRSDPEPEKERLETPAREGQMTQTGSFEEAGPVAIIGLSAVMPQSEDAREFWENLAAGRDLITGIPAGRAQWLEGIAGAKFGGFMKEVDKFDADFFNISPREARMIDPQQRILLETVWKAIEDAGYNPKSLAGSKTGIFIGVSSSDYYDLLIKNNVKFDAVAAMGISNSIRVNRLSFQLDFHGPSEPIDTACSSSLVAIHRGVEAIRSGDCEMAVAGGVNVMLTPTLFNAFDSAGMLSADGRCRSFDSRAAGYVRGEGVGVVILKPLAAALRDGDDIYAVIRATVENHGGRAKSLTAPNVNAQAQLVVEAYRRAGIGPETVTYIEAHGTGTTLGDPAEVNALKKAFKELFELSGKPLPSEHYCGLGTVKTNIGHLEAAAGIAGVIKVVMALQHGKIPASLNFKEINPYIDLSGSPFYIVNRTKDWERLTGPEGEPIPRRAGISSFGYGGSNAHIVVEEFRGEPKAEPLSDEPQLVVLSARDRERLREYAEKFRKFLAEEHGVVPDAALAARLEAVQTELLQAAAEIGGVKRTEIDPHVALDDYGFDLMALTLLTERINDRYGTGLHPSGLGDHLTIAALASRIAPDNSGGPGAASGLSLAEIAYTLQTGREPLVERLAVVAQTPEELSAKLQCYLQEKPVAGLYYGNVNGVTGAPEAAIPSGGTSGVPADLDRNAALFVAGAAVDWDGLRRNGRPERRHLPTYPFERKRHWFDQETPSPGLLKKADRPESEAAGAVLPPKLLLKNRTNDVPPEVSPAPPVPPPSGRISPTVPGLVTKLKELLGAVLYTETAKLDEAKPFVDLGLDSILGVEYVKKLKDELKVNLKTTQLYDYSTLTALGAYLASRDAPPLIPAGYEIPEHQEDRTVPPEEPAKADAPPAPGLSVPVAPGERPAFNWKDVAIIGIAARYPGAANPERFWENLKNGVASVSEVPPERWDVSRYYDPDPNAPEKVYCKWGGFLEEIDRFDPLFFNISPAEAEVIEPQQRLFLQEVWRALEDAGYAAEDLNNVKCGVYAGVMTQNEYPSNLFNAHSILAARAAYFLNLKGPALSLDTACSSSLVAIHLACRSLIDGETDLMIAGGVSLYLTVKPYLGMCKSGMLSPEGKCKTFDDGADGFVPGEGVGVVVLKLLDQALADGDHVYGIIKGSGLNQDGRTNGITAPSAWSQTQLELAVFQNSRINPETITYVECHGTGTKLGDPIEMEALAGSFGHYTSKRHYCRIGSLKSNIGHTAAASGVGGVIKVLLSLKHGRIPPTLNFKKINGHIRLEESPFVVNTGLSSWDPPPGVPRRAAVSSFGFSGTNAHLIIEEPPAVPVPVARERRSAYLIILSAKHRGGLEEQIQNLRQWLDNEAGRDLGDIAFTLAAGRSHFPYRCAIVAADLEELRDSLDGVREGKPSAGCGTGKVEAACGGFAAAATVKYLLEKLSKTQNPEEYREMLLALADFYRQGAAIDWNSFYRGAGYRRISLPAYPFKKDRYWSSLPMDAPVAAAKAKTRAAFPNPLEGSAGPRDGRNRFRLRLSGNEFFFTDNVVYGEKVLPGVAYLEIARAAGRAAEEQEVERISKLFWLSPVTAEGQPVELEIELAPGPGERDFTICALKGDSRELKARGRIGFSGSAGTRPAAEAVLNPEQVKGRCLHFIRGDDCYRGYRARRFVIGPGLQAIKVMHYNDSEALAELELPPEGPALESFGLHPALMDAALQTVTGMLINSAVEPPGRPYLSFSLGEAVILRPLTAECYVYAGYSASRAPDKTYKIFNIRVADRAGNVQVILNDFCIKQPLVAWDPDQPTRENDIGGETGFPDETAIIAGISRDVAALAGDLLKLDAAELDCRESLSEYGFTSIAMISFIDRVNRKFGIDSAPEMFFDAAIISVQSLAQSLYRNFGGQMRRYYQKWANAAGRMEVAASAAAAGNGEYWRRLKELEEEILKLAEGEFKLGEQGDLIRDGGGLIRRINAKYGLAISPGRLRQSPSLGAFIKDLFRDYQEKFRAGE